ncbi:metalloregulator ArsR/SmtB family transcription factor [Ancylobacter sp. TS-1]|uniref:metalloregulator ArsR/SmtB family transcription factor n=1 Tax=Ancylobacter sp. TS-1 TaxID=1850374 RepID=UPI001265C5DF|nr:metalloregulator ArsR/SmtB family transcription factor [Ancylobacter sp. TS-1]QFR34672.1 metalloregulator ArsR/SmtB family transcription factor [Ancylobacter sp. TS-1]
MQSQSKDVKRLVSDDAVEMFDVLAQPTRFDAFRLLLRYAPFGLNAGDVARLLAVPHNTMSTHLAQLERAGLVASRREGRSIIYAAKTGRAAAVLELLLSELPAQADAGAGFPRLRPGEPAERRYNVLLVCSHNSARSIMAEAVLNREGRGRFRAFSAGSVPRDTPHPLALDLLRSLGYTTDDLRSKSWDEFAGRAVEPMDFVITVCDAAAGESCPLFPGHPLTAHWGLSDPAASGGTETELRAAFISTYRQIAARMSAFVNLPLEALDLASLKARLGDISVMDGATEMTLAARAA